MKWNVKKEFIEGEFKNEDSWNEAHGINKKKKAIRTSRNNIFEDSSFDYIVSRSSRSEKIKSEMKKSLDIWNKYLSSNLINVDSCMGVSAMIRNSMWGGVNLLSTAEVSIIKDVCEGFSITTDVIMEPVRPTVNLGIWKITDRTICSITLLFPAIATSTVKFNESFFSLYEEARDRIVVELSSSKGSDGQSLKVLDQTTMLMVGKMTMSIAATMEHISKDFEKEHRFTSACTFVNLSSSTIIVKLMYRGRLRDYYFGGNTTSYIYSILSNKFSSHIDDVSGIMIQVAYSDGMLKRKDGTGKLLGEDMVALPLNLANTRSDKSKLFIGNDGTIRYQGSPFLVKLAFRSLHEILFAVMSNPIHARQFITTLCPDF